MKMKQRLHLTTHHLTSLTTADYTCYRRLESEARRLEREARVMDSRELRAVMFGNISGFQARFLRYPRFVHSIQRKTI